MGSSSEQSEVLAYVEAQPGIKEWPELLDIVRRAMGAPRPDWELPVAVCSSIAGENEPIGAAVAALGCTQISIILVDDMLDEDPRGEHNRRGHASTANMAVALQAAAFGILAEAGLDCERVIAAQRALARLVLLTACGQEMDVAELPLAEDSYWRIVTAKSAPFYAASLQLGAIFAGANEELQDAFYDLGCILGELMQIQDDLADAFATPASPDWLAGRHNLPILYASLVDYPLKERFLVLTSKVAEPPSLAQAQQILISSGALSYCIYQLISRYRRATELLDQLALINREPLQRVFDQRLLPVVSLLDHSGLPMPAELGRLQR